MSTQAFLWALLALAGGTYAMRLAGILFRSRFTLGPVAERWIDRAVVVLLVGVVVTSTGFTGTGFGGFARLAGVAAAGIAIVCRAPLMLVLLVAVAVTGGLRLLGLS